MRWIVQRTVQAAITVWAVVSLSYVLVRLMPGSPVNTLRVEMQRQDIDPQIIEQRVQMMTMSNPEKPIPIDYANYMVDVLFRFNLGTSIWSEEPVVQLMAERAPWTIFLMSWATFLSFFIGIILGAFMAYYEGGKLDKALTTYAMIGGSIPYYIFAIYLILYLAIRGGFFPYAGRMPSGVDPGFNWPFIAGIIHYATLPTLSLVLSGGIASLSMRGNSIRILGEDYLRVARLRGLSDGTIAIQYVIRNAILPMYTGFIMSIGSMIGGSIILEMIFTYQGMGFLMVRSVTRRDVPVMMGVFMVITIAVVISLFVADLTYSKLDPRTGGEQSEAI